MLCFGRRRLQMIVPSASFCGRLRARSLSGDESERVCVRKMHCCTDVAQTTQCLRSRATFNRCVSAVMASEANDRVRDDRRSCGSSNVGNEGRPAKKLRRGWRVKKLRRGCHCDCQLEGEIIRLRDDSEDAPWNRCTCDLCGPVEGIRQQCQVYMSTHGAIITRLLDNRLICFYCREEHCIGADRGAALLRARGTHACDLRSARGRRIR